MGIQAIGTGYNQRQMSFKSRSMNYENPVDRGTERNLAVLKSVGSSALVGTVAGGLSSFIFTKGRKIPVGIGVVAGLATLALTLPQKLYSTKVNAYVREKEMDVFSRQNSAQASIYEDINEEIQDEKVSLDQKINHYSTVKMADNGKGMMIKGV